MLHTPHRNSGSSRYCGPTAIAAVTGLRGSDIRDAVRQARGNIMTAAGRQMPVWGMTNDDLIATMDVLGWSVVDDWREPERRQRIEGCGIGARLVRPPEFRPYPFVDFLREHGSDGPYIVNVTGHYIAVSHGELCDADANPLPQDIEIYLRRSSGGYRNSWVKRYWKFQAVCDCQNPDSEGVRHVSMEIPVHNDDPYPHQ